MSLCLPSPAPSPTAPSCVPPLPAPTRSPHTASRATQQAALQALATQAAEGQRPAAQQLFRALLPMARAQVRAAARTRALALVAADVEDIAQDALLAFWRADLPRFDAERGHVLGFLRRRIGWCVAEFARSQAKRLDRHVLAPEAADPVGTPGEARRALRGAPGADAGDDTEVRLQQAARELCLLAFPQALASALGQMEDRPAAKAVWMYDVQGLPLGEVARSLELHASNASRARRRGLHWLRTHLPAPLAAAA